jgi:hypothetical protein
MTTPRLHFLACLLGLLVPFSAVSQTMNEAEMAQFVNNQKQAWQKAAEAKQAADLARQEAQAASASAAAVRNNSESTRQDIEAAQNAEKQALEKSKVADENVVKSADAAKDSMFIGGSTSGFGAYTATGRMNDPFTFCTEGVPRDGWIATNPLAGAWTPIRACPACPNLSWVPVYTAICPLAMSIGPWVGPGRGSAFKADMTGTSPVVPFTH